MRRTTAPTASRPLREAPGYGEGSGAVSAAMTGTATYRGAAAGVYATMDVAGGKVTGARAGEFTADATLTAHFFGALDAGEIGGEIGSFRNCGRRGAGRLAGDAGGRRPERRQRVVCGRHGRDGRPRHRRRRALGGNVPRQRRGGDRREAERRHGPVRRAPARRAHRRRVRRKQVGYPDDDHRSGGGRLTVPTEKVIVSALLDDHRQAANSAQRHRSIGLKSGGNRMRARTLAVVAATLCVMVLAACGGGGGGGPAISKPEPTEPTEPADPGPSGVTIALPQNHGLAAGGIRVAPGASRELGNVVVSCPAGGAACVVAVAVDGTASYERTGGMPTVMAAYGPWSLPPGHGLSAGEIRVAPGASRDLGNVVVSCPAGGAACVVTVAADGDGEL